MFDVTKEEQELIAKAEARATPPDVAFRAFKDPSNPALGRHVWEQGDILLWSQRLGLPHPREWEMADPYNLLFAATAFVNGEWEPPTRSEAVSESA